MFVKLNSVHVLIKQKPRKKSPLYNKEHPPSAGTVGTLPVARLAEATVADVAEEAEAADLGASHARAAEAAHVLARSARVSSRSDFMEPTSRKKVTTPGNLVQMDESQQHT